MKTTYKKIKNRNNEVSIDLHTERTIKSIYRIRLEPDRFVLWRDDTEQDGWNISIWRTEQQYEAGGDVYFGDAELIAEGRCVRPEGVSLQCWMDIDCDEFLKKAIHEAICDSCDKKEND